MQQPKLRRVVLESPFKAPTEADQQRNLRYARAALRDSVLRNEAPLASHLLLTQPGVLRDEVTAERRLGIAAGHAWIGQAEAVIVYIDLGISEGMRHGISEAERLGVTVEHRTLPKLTLADVLAPQ